MKAKVVYTAQDTSEIIEIGDHRILCGGPGDGFCSTHQSFKCIENLTEEEQFAFLNAEEI